MTPGARLIRALHLAPKVCVKLRPGPPQLAARAVHLVLQLLELDALVCRVLIHGDHHGAPRGGAALQSARGPARLAAAQDHRGLKLRYNLRRQRQAAAAGPATRR